MKKVFEKIKESGLIEFIFLSLSLISHKISSIIRIFFLRRRLYKVEYSVLLGSNIVIFQSTKNSIEIGKDSFIGDGVRLKAGFNGKIKIGKKVYIHDYSFIFAHKKLTIGDFTLISPNVFITDFDHKLPYFKYKDLLGSKDGYVDKDVSIGKNVWVGTHVTILPGVNIGDGAVIGAGSVVTKNIPSNVIAAGVPAKVIKRIN